MTALLLSAALSGCTTTTNGRRPMTSWWPESRKTVDTTVDANSVNKARKELKYSEQLHLKYGEMQEASGQLVEARRAYELILSDEPGSVGATLGLARLDNLAGRKALAQQGYQRALALQPNDPATLAAVGQYYSSENQWPKAVQYLNSAMLSSPNNATYRYELAVALAKSGDVQSAFPHFESTVGGEAEAHYNIGYIMYEAGNVAAAEQQFALAVSKKPNLWTAQQMLNEIRNNPQQNGSTMLAQGTASSTNGRMPPQGQVAQTGFIQPAVQSTSNGPAAVPQNGIRNLVGRWKTSVIPAEEVARSQTVNSGGLQHLGRQSTSVQPQTSPQQYGQPQYGQPVNSAPNPYAGSVVPAGANPAIYGPNGNLTLRQWEQMQNQLRAAGQ